MDSLPIWAIWSTIPGVVVLAPVLAFLLATATVIIIGLLKEVAVPAVLAFTAAGISGWLLARKARRGGQRRSSLTRRSDVSNAVPAAPTSAQSGRASPPQVRTRLHAGGSRIRTLGPPVCWLLRQAQAFVPAITDRGYGRSAARIVACAKRSSARSIEPVEELPTSR